MNISFFRSNALGQEIARAVAAARGGVYDPQALGVDGERLLTAYFEDVRSALSPRFDHIDMVEFTRLKLSAYAAESPGDRPYVHMDQYLDRWLLAAVQLLGLRAFYKLEGDNRQAVNALFTSVLEMAFDPTAHERMKGDMVHVFTDFPESLRVTHELGVAGLVFIACHELAHHSANHLDAAPGHDVEYAADREGLRLMRSVYTSQNPLKLIRRPPFAMAGASILLSLWDLIERAAALKSGLSERTASHSHPFASDRLARLLADITRDPEAARFVEGFAPAVQAYRQDLGLAAIA